MVYSVTQDFMESVRVKRQLNGNRNALPPIRNLQDDFTQFMRDALRKAAIGNPALAHENGIYEGTAYVGALDLGSLEVIYAVHSMVLHDGLSDVVIIRSQTDERHLVLSGDSLKKNLKDGVMVYDLPLQDLEAEVIDLLAPYSALSVRLKALHNPDGRSLSYRAITQAAGALFQPVADPHALYEKYFSHLVYPEPEAFLTRETSLLRRPSAP